MLWELMRLYDWRIITLSPSYTVHRNGQCGRESTERCGECSSLYDWWVNRLLHHIFGIQVILCASLCPLWMLVPSVANWWFHTSIHPPQPWRKGQYKTYNASLKIISWQGRCTDRRETSLWSAVRVQQCPCNFLAYERCGCKPSLTVHQEVEMHWSGRNNC